MQCVFIREGRSLSSHLGVYSVENAPVTQEYTSSGAWKYQNMSSSFINELSLMQSVFIRGIMFIK